jgi:HNH endonuclease
MTMKKIQGFENYEVDELGQVWSLPKKTRKGTRLIKALRHPKTGYMYLDLCKDGKIKKFTVHRLVALAYLPNPENKPQVNHINGDKTDNRVVNLEWCTRSENQKHSIDIGLRTTKGVKNSQCKLNEEEVIYIKNSDEKGKILAKKFNISHSTICDIRSGRSWTHI